MNKLSTKSVVNIVITGGPCAGKSVSLQYVKWRLEKQGWTVLVVPETATELITGGVAPWVIDNYGYHVLQLRLHDTMERTFREAADRIDSDKVVIIYDRGQPDATAYIDYHSFYRICFDYHLHTGEESNYYDAVFHLETTAKKHPEYYGLDTNAARHESVEEAIELDDKILRAYHFHPNRVIIDGEEYFGHKLQNLCNSIESFLSNLKD